MPIYEYLCESCGKVNEQLQKVNDPPPARCDECGSRKLAKLVSRSAFQLKGGGWYSDLYASKKEKAGPSKDGKDAAAPATGSLATASPADGKPADGKPADARPAPKAEPATPAKAAATDRKETKKAATGD